MWIPSQLTALLGLNADLLRTTQADLAATRAERDVLKVQLGVAQNNFEWIRLRLNQMELERAGLLEKAYGVKVPVPELARQAHIHPGMIEQEFSFDHVDEELAKKLGIEKLIS